MSTSPKLFRAFDRHANKMVDRDDHRVMIRITGELEYEWKENTLAVGSPYLDILQYTGVDDDAGAKLYETDVVETDIGRALIGFQHGFFCLNWLEKDGSLSECNVELIGNDWKGRKREKLVRLGNSLEKPELMKTP